MSRQEALGIALGVIPCDDEAVMQQALEKLAEAGGSN